jgi:hypothetical protein
MNNIEIMPVRSRKDLKKFIFLPEKIHRENSDWLPPLYMDEWALYDPGKNKSFSYCDHLTLIAHRNGEPAGRIMGLINHRYNENTGNKDGRFCFMESVNDPEVSGALIAAVEDWARERGMTRIVGPFAFSDKDPQGVQVEGFEYTPVLAAPNNGEWLGSLIEAAGYTVKEDLVEYLADIPSEIPEVYKRVLSRIGSNPDYRIIEFRNKKELKRYIIPILELMNETYTDHIYGYVPMTDKEKLDFARRYMPVLNPKFIKAFAIKGELAGFVIAMPDIAEGLRKARGRILPFGFIHILKAVRKSKQLLMLLGAIKAEHRGIGIDAILGAKMLETASNSKMKTLDSHLILGYNRRMQAEYERVGGKVVKRFRIYQKDL